MSVDYDHAKNVHGLNGPLAACAALFRRANLTRVLDVGCGTGTWLKAALTFGAREIVGLDGVNVPEGQLLIPRDAVIVQDLTQEWTLCRCFDTVLCLEVAEHLEATYAEKFIQALTRHGDTIAFSAAPPGQPGQHHVNCQWPVYWQAFFNANGFRCSDEIRWEIWEDARVEPWYRQNMFLATRDPQGAGREPRLKSVVHPEMVEYLASHARSLALRQIEDGEREFIWYWETFVRGVVLRVRRLAVRRPVKQCK